MVCFTGHGPNTVAHLAGMVRGGDIFGDMVLPRGIMGIWGHPVAGKPAGWAHAGGGSWANGAPTGHGANRPNLLGRFLKHTSGVVNGGTAAGSDAHSHAKPSHSHSITGAATPQGGGEGDPTVLWASATHAHSLASDSLPGIIGSSDLPPCVDVAFLVRD